MTSFSIMTLGCKVNTYESEAIINDLIGHGWVLKDFQDKCDVYIVNTCTVTATSDQKSRQMLHSCKRKNPDAIVVAMGCYAQLNSEKVMTMADCILGSSNKMQVYNIVNSYLETKKSINNVLDVMHHPDYEEMKISKLTQHTRGFIKIQDGCENFCAYCAIPFSRGNIRSRKPDNVIDEINYLVNEGTKEIILAGINTGSYGRDLKTINFAGLITRIMEETKIHRLRISSIELMEITDELLDVLYKYRDRIAHHFHIPLQGGCDNTLKRMRRKYNTAEYYETVCKIRKLFPGCAITTDCLAGFVGETEQDYQDSLDFIRKIGYAGMHVFPYSRRKNTLADRMEGHLDPGLIKERARGIIKVAAGMKLDYEKKFIGKTLEVLVEQKKDNMWVGHTSNYLEVHFDSDENLANTLQFVEIEKIENNKIIGRMK